MSVQKKRPNQIFICYRREDTAGVAGRIYDRLVQRFGKEAVFKDVDDLPLGRDFRRHIDSVVSECCVALVVVGDRWIGASGASRLDDPRDYVRIEIESALKRDIPVIPLLVQNAALPPDESLPESLKDFSYRNGMSIGHDPHFHPDMDRLIKCLNELIEDQSRQTEAQSAAAPGSISAHEQVARPEEHGSSDTDQHPIQGSAEQALPTIMVSSPQTATAASQQVETQTDSWIAAKDRRRIVASYLCLWLVVNLIGLGLIVFVCPFPPNRESYRHFLIFVSLLLSMILAGGQSMILKSYIGPAKRWIGYTFVASVIDNLVRFLISSWPPVFVWAMLFNNLTRGGLQWLLLRTFVKRAWLWIVAGVAAGMAYSLVVWAVGLSAWTVRRDLGMALLGSSLTAAAEIVCLIRFRRK